MCTVNRVWTALLLLATVIVAGGVVYVLAHNDNVVNAGKTPGYSSTLSAPLSPGLGTTTGGSATSGSGSTSTSTSTSTGGSTSGSPISSSTTVAFLGDNWTRGSGASSPAKAFPGLVAASLGVKDVVIAEDGSGYAKHGNDGNGKNYGDLAADVIAKKPDVIVVSGGRNDLSDDVNTLKNAAQDLFSQFKTKLPGVRLVAVAPFWGDSAHPTDLSRVDSAVKDAVQAAGGTYLDIPDPIRDHADWMADAANPNDDGNKAIATALEAKLQPLLAEA